METRDVAGRCFARIQKCLPILSLCWAGCLPGWMQSRLPLERPQPCVLPENVSKQELVAHLNHNRQQLRSWRSTDVSIQAVGAGPMRLGASLAVESPRRFRLIAKSLRGVEADLGSNQDRFWYWMRADGTPYIFTAHHRDTDLVQRQLEIPFQPEWLMEALGVVPLQAEDFEIQRHGLGDNRVSLVSTQSSAEGLSLYREMIVDTCRGWVIEHGLYDADRQPLARAVMSEYALHDGILMPHRVELSFPRNGQSLVLRIGDVELNPQQMESLMWEFPRIPDHRPLDIGQQIRRMQQRRGAVSHSQPVSPDHRADPETVATDDPQGWWETPAIEIPADRFRTGQPHGAAGVSTQSAGRQKFVSHRQAAAGPPEFPWASPSDVRGPTPSTQPRPAGTADGDGDEPMWADPE